MKRVQLVLAYLLLLPACGGDGGTGPSGGATLSGIVREEGTNQPIAGALVSVASLVSATTAQDGSFTLRGAPVGSALSLSVSASGYDAHEGTISIVAGSNTHNVSLARKRFFAFKDELVYLPPEVTSYRGVLYVLFGSTSDSRPFLRGDLGFYASFPAYYGNLPALHPQLLAFARAHNFALAAGRTPPDIGSTFGDMQAAINAAATESGHAELANAPMLFYGHSFGGCIAYAFSRLNSARVIGFMTSKGGCHQPPDADGAVALPGYFFIGENDEAGRALNINQVFDLNRAAAAPWAVAIERGRDHQQVADTNLILNWLTDVVALRLPQSGTALRPINVADGWLGNRTTFEIAPYACYTGDRSTASWLPTERTARDWQRLVSSGSVNTQQSCG